MTTATVAKTRSVRYSVWSWSYCTTARLSRIYWRRVVKKREVQMKPGSAASRVVRRCASPSWRTSSAADLKLVVAQDPPPRAAPLAAVDFNFGSADHEIRVNPRIVDLVAIGLILDAVPESSPVGDVAGCVLVEERVEEGQVQLTYRR